MVGVTVRSNAAAGDDGLVVGVAIQGNTAARRSTGCNNRGRSGRSSRSKLDYVIVVCVAVEDNTTCRWDYGSSFA